jgi:predicted nuclease of predicted toxin-antitoxin system
VILLLDENMPPRVADALHALGTVEAYHVTKYLPRGATDVEVFAFLADKSDWILVTQDDKIRRRPHELAALRAANVGAFVLTGRAGRTVEGMLSFLAACLDGMRRQVAATKRPFIVGISDRKRFDRLA